MEGQSRPWNQKDLDVSPGSSPSFCSGLLLTFRSPFFFYEMAVAMSYLMQGSVGWKYLEVPVHRSAAKAANIMMCGSVSLPTK